ncbi:DNA glycosylase [Muribacter muris]|uniref:DNA glycosylase n=1 Tax=Muribacter muris TaxID=67855 RepID=A0A4Y9JXA9_9PAST|nr:DNA glycosylase [Muribacter muris]MBF0785459.1 DNA glycosylase [Muribacter muris]MBF0828107.1 DNA glycosylase [Muribacter muris]TFV09589.1 DNA glycosylase [Muribacter muris]
MTQLIEKHPFPAILPPQATVMMMGTFPPTLEKRCMDFHYPNFQNDMWRIYGAVFFDDTAHFQVDGEKRFDPIKIEAFLRTRGIGLCSTAQTAIREKGNASDKFLKIVEPVDLTAVLAKLPACRWLFTTGEKATETLLDLLPEKLKMPKTNQYIAFPYLADRPLFLYRLPSTSRAYPLSLAKKVEAYRAFFQQAGIL